MVFKRKDSFFLDLSGGESKPAVQVALVQETKPATASTPTTKPTALPTAQPTTAQPGAKPAVAAAGGAEAAVPSGAATLTTAEAIAAELAAAQAARPAPSSATFAPDGLNPANAVPTLRRRAGANLAGFKAMAASLIRS